MKKRPVIRRRDNGERHVVYLRYYKPYGKYYIGSCKFVKGTDMRAARGRLMVDWNDASCRGLKLACEHGSILRSIGRQDLDDLVEITILDTRHTRSEARREEMRQVENSLGEPKLLNIMSPFLEIWESGHDGTPALRSRIRSRERKDLARRLKLHHCDTCEYSAGDATALRLHLGTERHRRALLA